MRPRILAGSIVMVMTYLTDPRLVVAQEEGAPITITPERMLEAESPQYRAMSDQQRVALIAQWALDKGGYDAMMLSLIKSISSRNNQEALYVSGMVYRYPSWRATEFNLETDEQTACINFGFAAEQGHPYAAQEYALCFFAGRGGVKQDRDKALKWFEQAAGNDDAGMAYAKYMTGLLYLDRARTSGNEQDRDKGIAWLTKAAEKGDEEASRLLREIGADSKETPEDTSEEIPVWLKPVETE